MPKRDKRGRKRPGFVERRRIEMASYKWICVPQNRDVVDPVAKKRTGEIKVLFEDYSFYTFLVNVLLPDAKFGKGWKANRAAGEIEESFRDAAPGTWVKIHATSYDILKSVCDEPTTPWANPHLLLQVADFFEAIVERARDDEPKSEPTGAASESAPAAAPPAN